VSDENKYILALSILEINGDSSQLKFVQIEKDIAQNLTCFNNKGSQNARIEWFQVNYI
jgi:hypothetical protein